MPSVSPAGTMADPSDGSGLHGSVEHGWNEAPLAGSRAVLAALRSLQEKIRRLEAERNSHLGSYEALRTKCEVQRAQAEGALQQEQSTRELDEQRHRSALAQLEEQLRLLRDERDAAVAAHQTALQCAAEQQTQADRLLGTAREEHHQRECLLQQQLERALSELAQLKGTLSQAEQREKMLLSSLDQQELAQQRGWEQQLEGERRMLDACQQQKQQLQATVADLLKLNNALLARVKEPEQPVKKTTKKAARVAACSAHQSTCCAARQARSSTPCRSRSPTAASLAKAVSHPLARNADCLDDALDPFALHNGTAQSHLQRANLGHPVPFLLGSSTSSHSAIAAAQMGLEVGRENSRPLAAADATDPHPLPCTEADGGSDLTAGLHELTAQLEAEYSALNQQYLQVLRQVQATSGITTTADLTVLLSRLLEDMDAKGSQIRKLRRLELASHLPPGGPRSSALTAGLERRSQTLRLFSSLKQHTHCRPLAS